MPAHGCYQQPPMSTVRAYLSVVKKSDKTGVEIKRKEAALHGFGWGIVGGLALVGLMYYAGAFLGLRPLPQLLTEPLLSVMPGFVFGFLIDTLQHAGKVVEEAGLIVLMLVLLCH